MPAPKREPRLRADVAGIHVFLAEAQQLMNSAIA
jgi:hypothetical protein